MRVGLGGQFLSLSLRPHHFFPHSVTYLLHDGSGTAFVGIGKKSAHHAIMGSKG